MVPATKVQADETASRARRTQRTAVAQAYGVREGEGVHTSGGPGADLVAAVAPHLALRAVALALRAHILAERDVVERALRLDLGLHAVRHALVEGALEPALALLDLVELEPVAARVVAAAAVGAGHALGVVLEAVRERLLLGDLLESEPYLVGARAVAGEDGFLDPLSLLPGWP